MILKNFSDIYNYVAEYTRQTSGSIANLTALKRIKAAVNRTYFDLCAMFDIRELEMVFQQDTVSGDTAITLPGDLNGIISIHVVAVAADATQNWPLEVMEITRYERRFPVQSTVSPGNPQRCAIKRLRSLSAVTLGLATLTAESTSASDGSASAPSSIYATLVGYIDSARQNQEVQRVALTGTTPVSFADQLYEPISFSKSDATVGFVILKRSAVEIARIAPWRSYAEYHTLITAPVPNNTFTYEIRARRRPPLMVNDTDIPWFIDPEYWWTIAHGANAEIMKYVGKDSERQQAAMRDYQAGLATIQATANPFDGDLASFGF